MSSDNTLNKRVRLILIASTLIIISGLCILSLTKTDFDSRDFIEGFAVGIASVFLGLWLVILITTTYNKSKEKIDETKEFIKSKQYLSIGMLSLVLGFIIQRIHFESVWITIFSIILYLTSIIFNIRYIFHLKKIENK